MTIFLYQLHYIFIRYISSNSQKEAMMKKVKIVIDVALIVLLFSSIAIAAKDFGWVDGFNVQAQADPSGFRARLATRFHIGDAQISAVLGNVSNPADAYIVFRLGEMSGYPPDRVMREYNSGKGKGWGVIAKNLGIKPGSQEFHALKRGQDLYNGYGQGKGKGKGKGKHKY